MRKVESKMIHQHRQKEGKRVESVEVERERGREGEEGGRERQKIMVNTFTF